MKATGSRWRVGRAAVVAVVLTLLAGTAWAHPKLLRSRPAANGRLSRAPVRIQLSFNEELDTKGSRLTVWSEANEQVDRGNGRVSLDDRRLMEAGLKPLAPGRYTVKWRAMADDDKGVAQGEFTFQVTAAR